MTQPAIQVEQVWKKYRRGELYDSLREWVPALARGVFGRRKGELSDREFWALRDVSFEVRRGESIGIIGPNGAGKSTVLKMLSKIIRPTLGSCRVQGRVSALIEVAAGFHQDLTGRENIYLNGTILGMKRREIRGKEEAIIEFAGVREFIDTPVKRYSSGMKARLGFAVAAHLEPDVLLVDEVLSVGDAKFRAKCLNHMRGLIQSDVTVVFISHLLDQVRSLCPNTIVLDHGRSIYQGPTDGAIRTYLEALNDDAPAASAGAPDAEIARIRFCDAQGREVLAWRGGEPAVIQGDLLIRAPIADPCVQINVASVGGAYLGTMNSHRQGWETPGTPGTYPFQIVLDPMPLADGDYRLDFQVYKGIGKRQVIWALRQPRTVHVRAEGGSGAVVRFEARWERLESAPAVAQGAPDGQGAA